MSACWACGRPADRLVVTPDGNHRLCGRCAKARFPHAEQLSDAELRRRMRLPEKRRR